MSIPLLKLYSTGCARNSRTVPYTLGNPIITMNFPGIMDWQFQEVLETTDDVAMSVDFATLDNKWAYYVLADEKVSENSWRFSFTMCSLKTYMMSGKNTIKGKWNRTPTWVDRDTVTPAISGYKRGREIGLPGLLPVGWVFVEIHVRLAVGLSRSDGTYLGTNGERNITLGLLTKKDTVKISDMLSLKDVVYNLSDFNYTIDGGINYTSQIDVEQIENISYNRLCPYNFTIERNSDNSIKDITLVGMSKTFKMKRVEETIEPPTIDKVIVEETMDAIEQTYLLRDKGADATIWDAKVSMRKALGSVYGQQNFNTGLWYMDKALVTNSAGTVFFYFTKVGSQTEQIIPGVFDTKYTVIKYLTDPRGHSAEETGIKGLYVYNATDSTFNKNSIKDFSEPTILSGNVSLNLTNEEKKFGVATVLAPQVMGVIERSQTTISYRYEVDNTGWYLNIDLPMNKIVIPSMKLPYVSDTWRAYQMREMEYDRNELSRTNQYASDKFWGDLAKGMANGALAGGFAGTNSAQFGIAMGATQFIGTAIGATIDRRVETENNKRSYENTVDRMKTAVDSYYNSGYGYRMVDSTDYHINIAMPIDDMTNEVKVSGYSCTGNLTAVLSRGFIQGYPEPNNTIKGTIRNLIVNELQSGVWII